MKQQTTSLFSRTSTRQPTPHKKTARKSPVAQLQDRRAAREARTRIIVAGCILFWGLALSLSISWTGYGGDNQWTNRINWAPDQVPTLNDDVTIASGNVEVTIPTGANSIVMGTSFDKPANLTIFQSFFLGSGGLNVNGNGYVMLNAGTAAISGVVNLDGSLYFQSGMISGRWTVTQRGVADLSGAAQKVLSGCQLSVAGVLRLSGVLVLNQSSNVIVTSAATLSGSVSIQAQDSTAVLFDSSAGKLTYTGGGEFQIQAPVALGAFDFQGGNLTMYNDIAFGRNLTIPSGSYVASVGTATVKLTGGIAGAGVLTAAGTLMTIGASTFSGAVNAVSGGLTFSNGGTVATMTIAGGQVAASGGLTTPTLSLLAGALSGALQAANAYLKSPGFNLNGALTIGQQLMTSGTSLIAFGTGSALSITSSATLKVGGPLTLTGAVGPTITNDGTLVADYVTVIQNINLMGGGSASVSASLKISTATVQQNAVRLTGSGVFSGSATQIQLIPAVSGKPSVDGAIGAYRFSCVGECDNVRTVGTPTSDFSFRVGG